MRRIVFITIILFIALPLYADRSVTRNIKEWEYYSSRELNTSSRKIFEKNIQWSKINFPKNIKSNGGKYLLLKTSIDTYRYEKPVIYIKDVYLNIKVYDDNSMLYSHGVFKKDNRYFGKKSHIIDVKSNYQGGIYIIVYCPYGNASVKSSVLIGNKSRIMYRIFSKDIDDVVIFSILIFIGLLFIVTAFIIENTRKEFLPLGLFLVNLGFYLFGRIGNKGFIVEDVIIINYIEFASLYLLPVSLYYCVKKLWNFGKRNCMKKLMFLHIFFFYFALLFSLFGLLYLHQTLNYFLLLVFLTFPVTASKMIYTSIKGDTDSRILVVGVLIFSAFAGLETMSHYNILKERYEFIHIGMFIFALSLITVILRRIASLYRSLNSVKLKLESYTGNLESMVKERTSELKLKNEELNKKNFEIQKAYNNLEQNKIIIDNDLKLAKNIQQNYLLENIPYSPDWDAEYRYLPYSEVSGDIYDFYKDKDDCLSSLILFDVSGHGVSSGLITMIAKIVAFQKYKKFKNRSLVDWIYEINYDLTEEIENVDNYLSGILMRFSQDYIEYVNCGHCDVMIRRAQTGKTEFLIPENYYKGSILGYDKEMQLPTLVKEKINPGDEILIYTDGLIESAYKNNITLGISKLLDLFQNCPYHTPSEIIDFIVDKESKFSKSNCFDDDVTVICLKKK